MTIRSALRLVARSFLSGVGWFTARRFVTGR